MSFTEAERLEIHRAISRFLPKDPPSKTQEGAADAPEADGARDVIPYRLNLATEDAEPA